MAEYNRSTSREREREKMKNGCAMPFIVEGSVVNELPPAKSCLFCPHFFFLATFISFQASWWKTQCLINYFNGVYHIGLNGTEYLDPSDFSVTILGSVPADIVRPGRCAGVEIGGRRGIMTR